MLFLLLYDLISYILTFLDNRVSRGNGRRRVGGVRVGSVRGLVGRVNRRGRNGGSGGRGGFGGRGRGSSGDLVRGASGEVGGVSDASLNNVRHDSC